MRLAATYRDRLTRRSPPGSGQSWEGCGGPGGGWTSCVTTRDASGNQSGELNQQGTKTVWLNYISAEMTMKVSKQTPEKKRIITAITLHQRRSESRSRDASRQQTMKQDDVLVQRKSISAEKWWNWRIPSVGRFSILHAFCFNLSFSAGVRLGFHHIFFSLSGSLLKLQWRHFLPARTGDNNEGY